MAGTGSPIGAAPGATATLSGASLAATLPPSLPQTGFELGIFRAGHNAIPSQVWISVAASNATPATQVRELRVTASTTIKVNGRGAFVSGTPIVVRIPIPNTTWTVAGPGGVSFSQAGPGTLPSLPVGVGDRLVPVQGSIVVKPTLASLRFVIDCQPGTTVAPFKTLAPALAPAFAGLDAAAPVPPTPRPAIASSRLQRAAGRVALSISCSPGAADCRGRASIRSLTALRDGGRLGLLTIASARSYTVAAGTRRSVRLTLTPAARRVLRTRRSLRVRATLDPASGANVSRTLTLNR